MFASRTQLGSNPGFWVLAEPDFKLRVSCFINLREDRGKSYLLLIFYFEISDIFSICLPCDVQADRFRIKEDYARGT